ncbi:MAG: glutamate--cysteine ligase, partial [Burkholderiaceae bacterium]
LRERGVEYVEVRLMDLNPFIPIGIDAATLRFLDVFLLHCLSTPSPLDTPAEIAALARNQHLTAARGREPGLQLEQAGQPVLLTAWGQQLLQECAPIAAALDAAHSSTDYSAALAAAAAALQQPDSLPSARVLHTMRQHHGDSFAAFARQQSAQTRAALLALPLDAAAQARFQGLAVRSFEEQKAIEALDSMPFEIYRQQYVSPERLGLGWGQVPAASPAVALAA